MADKKLLEEATIRRFMQLANIKASEKGVLSESMNGEVAGGRSATPTRGTSGKVQTAGQTGPIREKKKKVPADEEKMEEGWDVKEETVEEADDMEMDMGDDMPADDVGGDDAGMEGGELESAVEDVVAALNKVFAAAGLDKEVEVDSGSEGGEEDAPADDMGDVGMEDEGGAPMMEKKEKMEEEETLEEELEESVELVDDALIEKLVKRVSDRLVAEARKAKEQKLAEAKKGGSGNWLSKPAHSKPPKGHGAGKSKKSTPFSKSVSVKGTAGRGR